MKPLFALGLAGLLFAAAAARGQLIAEESFSYPPGSLNGQNGGTGFATPWTVLSGTATVQNGSLTPAAPAETLATAGNSLSLAAINDSTPGNAVRTLGQPIVGTPGTTVWAGVVMKGTGVAGTTAAATFTLSDGTTNGYSIATGTTASANWSVTDAGTGLGQASTTVPNSLQSLLVARTTFGATNDVIDLFVNPIPGATPPGTATASVTLPHTATYTTVQLRFANLGTGTTLYDEIRVGTTFAAVTGVPEPSTLLLAGAAGLTGMAIRRRRKCHTGGD